MKCKVFTATNGLVDTKIGAHPQTLEEATNDFLKNILPEEIVSITQSQAQTPPTLGGETFTKTTLSIFYS